jgi:hypothetical protein
VSVAKCGVAKCGSPHCTSPAREAGAGLVLCWPCRDHIGQDVRTGALLWHELLDCMMPGAAGYSDVVSTTPERGLRLDPRAVGARHDIREALTFWAHIVQRGRGLGGKLASVEQQSELIAHEHNLTWLAAQEFAPRAASDMHEIAWGEPMRVARPSGTRSRPLGACPETGCDGQARALLRRPESLRPSVVECTRGHTWEPYEWSKLWPAVAPESPRVGMDEAMTILQISSDSVRQLVASGRLARYGNYRAEFLLTDLDELRDELWPISAT